MSSGGQASKTKQEVLAEYEKDYLARLETQRESKDSELIERMKIETESLEKKEYIGFCEFCKMGVGRDEMTYKNGYLFHSNCFEQQGENFPAANQELLMQNSNAKVQLALLKNLKARAIAASNPVSSKSRPKTKKKSKRKAKKRRPKRRATTKRKKTKRKTRTKKRRTATKRKRPTRRKASRRKSRRRPARKRSSRSKTRRRPTRRRSSRKKRARRRR